METGGGRGQCLKSFVGHGYESSKSSRFWMELAPIEQAYLFFHSTFHIPHLIME